jgi:hypothetical protein
VSHDSPSRAAGSFLPAKRESDAVGLASDAADGFSYGSAPSFSAHGCSMMHGSTEATRRSAAANRSDAPLAFLARRMCRCGGRRSGAWPPGLKDGGRGWKEDGAPRCTHRHFGQAMFPLHNSIYSRETKPFSVLDCEGCTASSARRGWQARLHVVVARVSRIFARVA